MDKKKKAPTFEDRYLKNKPRRFAAEPNIGSPDAEFVMPQPNKNRVPGQNYFVFSCVAPEGTRVKCRNVAMKPCGMFNTEAEANRHAQAVRDEDPRFDVHVICPEWVILPIAEDIKPLIRKEYVDKYMTKVMGGLQSSLMQSKKEMDERVARDKAKAEAELRKKYGPDYVMAKKTEQVKEYEKKQEERADRTEAMKFSQKDLVENLAKFIVTNKTINPSAAGEFLKFFEAANMAAAAPEGADYIAVSVPDHYQPLKDIITPESPSNDDKPTDAQK